MRKAIPLFLVISFLLACSIKPVFADIAPPQQPAGANPGLLDSQQTMVEMTYETILIEVGNVSNLFYTENTFEAVNASVTCLFLMTNNGEKEEVLETVFPLSRTDGMGDGRFNFPEIRNIEILVNDLPVSWEIKETPNMYHEDNPPIKWAAFEVVYPTEKVTAIEVRYNVQSTGYLPEATFYYVLETGAGWYGPIGEANISMIFPYEASEEFFLFGDHNIFNFNQKTVEGVTYEGNRARWQYFDLDPEQSGNWEATIIDPRTWQEILELRKKIEDGDQSAYSVITHIYDGLVMDRGVREGAEHFVSLNLAMYHHAMTAEPTNADLFARYADFQYFLFSVSYEGLNQEINLWEIYDAAVHALSLDETNETASRIKRDLENFHNIDPTLREEKPTEMATEESGKGIHTVEPEPTETTNVQKNKGSPEIPTIFGIIGFGIALGGGYLLGVKRKKVK